MNTEIRTTLNLPREMATAIDNYWHSAQLRSRNEAIRDLLRWALIKLAAEKLPKEKRRA